MRNKGKKEFLEIGKMSIEKKINEESREKREMKGEIKIDKEKCKGCGLCVEFCPTNNIEIFEKSNKAGYFPAQAKNNYCTGCANCAIVCPDVCIEVYKKGEINVSNIDELRTR